MLLLQLQNMSPHPWKCALLNITCQVWTSKYASPNLAYLVLRKVGRIGFSQSLALFLYPVLFNHPWFGCHMLPLLVTVNHFIHDPIILSIELVLFMLESTCKSSRWIWEYLKGLHQCLSLHSSRLCSLLSVVIRVSFYISFMEKAIILTELKETENIHLCFPFVEFLLC